MNPQKYLFIFLALCGAVCGTLCAREKQFERKLAVILDDSITQTVMSFQPVDAIMLDATAVVQSRTPMLISKRVLASLLRRKELFWGETVLSGFEQYYIAARDLRKKLSPYLQEAKKIHTQEAFDAFAERMEEAIEQLWLQDEALLYNFVTLTLAAFCSISDSDWLFKKVGDSLILAIPRELLPQQPAINTHQKSLTKLELMTGLKIDHLASSTVKEIVNSKVADDLSWNTHESIWDGTQSKIFVTQEAYHLVNSAYQEPWVLYFLGHGSPPIYHNMIADLQRLTSAEMNEFKARGQQVLDALSTINNWRANDLNNVTLEAFDQQLSSALRLLREDLQRLCPMLPTSLVKQCHTQLKELINPQGGVKNSKKFKALVQYLNEFITVLSNLVICAESQPSEANAHKTAVALERVAGHAAGIFDWHFAQILDNINEHIPTKTVVYRTCFGGGIKQLELVPDNRAYHFDIISAAAHDTTVYVKITEFWKPKALFTFKNGAAQPQLVPAPDYARMFNLLATTSDYTQALRHVIEFDPIGQHASNIPMVRYKESKRFKLLDAIPHMLVVSSSMRLQLSEGDQLDALFLKTTSIDGIELRDGDSIHMPRIMSSLPGDATHHIKVIKAPSIEANEAIGAFLRTENLKAKKIFKIDKMTLKRAPGSFSNEKIDELFNKSKGTLENIEIAHGITRPGHAGFWETISFKVKGSCFMGIRPLEEVTFTPTSSHFDWEEL